MRYSTTLKTLSALTALVALAHAAWSQSQPATQPAPAAAPPAQVTGKFVVPPEVDSFADRSLELLLYEADPRLADAPAKQIDRFIITPFSHTKGKETSHEFKIGSTATLNANRTYYVTAFVLDGEKRTHIGELDGKSGLAKVLTAGNPKDIKLVFRAVR